MLTLVSSSERSDIDQLLAGVRDRFGYDFTHYSRASLKRRLDRACQHARVGDCKALLAQLCSDSHAFDEFLRHMSVTVTEMFRDPGFFRSVREAVVPMLKTYPFVKIWHAGCATGEEAYSMAILLHEEGFLERCRIYATDFNGHSLECGQSGIYPSRTLVHAESNYLNAGGKARFGDYLSEGFDFVKVKGFLKDRVTFSYHNLVSDGVFGEMHLVCCRNVLIYFDKTLQARVLGVISESLRHGGFLGLGARENLNFTPLRASFEDVDARHRLYRKRS